MCVVAEGLSRTRRSAYGWGDPDVSVTPAGCEHTISEQPAERAGQGGGERETQPRTGMYYS